MCKSFWSSSLHCFVVSGYTSSPGGSWDCFWTRQAAILASKEHYKFAVLDGTPAVAEFVMAGKYAESGLSGRKVVAVVFLYKTMNGLRSEELQIISSRSIAKSLASLK